MPCQCPFCQVPLSAPALVPWGDGRHQLPLTPWICGACGGLGILTLATGEVVATDDAMWEAVRQKNPALWREIVQVRTRIRPPQEDSR